MFGKDKDKGPDLNKIQSAVVAAGGAGVRNLTVRQQGDVVEIHGEADSIQSKQAAFKQITDKVGDASGVINKIQTVEQHGSRPAGASMGNLGGSAAGGGQTRSHKVAKNETLGHIAQHYYGKASMASKIFEANRNQLSDPDKIREGMTLTIPA